MASRALMRRRTLSLVFIVLATAFQSMVPGSANTPSISLPATFNATTSFQTIGSTSVSNYSGDVQATISVSTGNIKITTTTGLTAPAGYLSTDWTSDTVREIAFYGTQSNVNLALGSLQYKASALGTVDTITVATFSAGAAYNPANGHFYEVITHSANINWEDARCRAKYGDASSFLGTANSSSTNGNTTRGNDQCSNKTSRRTLGGLNGYLANITSLEEHNFIFGKLNQTGWIGGSDFDSEGSWVWMDGPESGQVFWIQGTSSTRGGTNTIGGQSRFNYWNSNEPNNASSREHFAEFGFGGSGAWNDCQNACGRTRYVIEYGGDGGTLSGASGSISVRTAPGAPGTPTATPGALSTALSWTAPASTGGASISGYFVEYRAGAGSWQTASSNTGSASTTYTVTGLTAGTSYTFRVSAINAAGTGTVSTVSSSATPTKATPTFASWSNVSKTFGDANYTVTAPTVNGSLGGTFSYASDSTSVISISGTTFTVAGAGSATITATFTPTDTTNYTTATTTHLVTVAKANQTITFNSLSPRTLGTGTVSLSATASSALSVTFTSATTNECTVSGTTVTLRLAGTCTINANQAGNANYNAASQVQRSFTISETLTITTPSGGALTGTYGSAYSLTLSALGGSGNNSFSLFSGSLPSGLSLSSAGTISGTPTAAGSSAITVRVTDSNTATATTNSFTLTIDSRTITIRAADRSATYTGSAVSVSNTYSITSGTLAGSDSITSLTYTYTSIPSGSYNSQTAPTNAGNYTITPSAASFSPGSAANYAITYETATLTISRATQTISFTAPTTKVFDSGSFTLPITDTTTSGLAITFASTTGSTCSVTGRTVSLLGAGTCTLTADQPGDSNYTAALQVSRSFTINKATTSLSSFSISSKTFGNAPFSLTAPTVASSIPGTFSYTSSNTLIATIADSSVTIVKAGSVTITALFTPTDSANYETSTITATLTINKAAQASLAISSATTVAFGSTLNLTALGGSGVGSVSFAVSSGDCTIAGSILTPTQVGSCSITATRESDDNYLAETSTVTIITITTGSATATLSFSSVSLTFGVSNQVTVSASVAGTVRFSVNTKVIKNCKARPTTLIGPFTATCSYKPDTRRPLTITAVLTPTDTRYATRTSTSGTFVVARRVGR